MNKRHNQLHCSAHTLILSSFKRLRRHVNMLGRVLLAIHKNCNRSILGVVPSIYRNTVGNLTVLRWFDINHHIGCLGVSRGIHATYNHYSCPLIDTGGVALDLNAI